jgi:hypothetical protein
VQSEAGRRVSTTRYGPVFNREILVVLGSDLALDELLTVLHRERPLLVPWVVMVEVDLEPIDLPLALIRG